MDDLEAHLHVFTDELLVGLLGHVREPLPVIQRGLAVTLLDLCAPSRARGLMVPRRTRGEAVDSRRTAPELWVQVLSRPLPRRLPRLAKNTLD